MKILRREKKKETSAEIEIAFTYRRNDWLNFAPILNLSTKNRFSGDIKLSL